VRVVEHWHRLPGEDVGPCPWRHSKAQLDIVPGNLPWLILLEQGLD